MKRSMVCLIMVLTGALLLGACGDSDSNPTLTTLTESDNGKTVQLRVADKLDVTLSENPSTGFVWEIEQMDQTIMKEAGDSEFTPGSGLGASGKRTFHFEAIASGRSDLKLINHRPFDTNSPPSSTFEVTVVVN